MMAIERLNRYQAFAIHLLLSLLFFLIVLLLITEFWYPGFLFQSAGGWEAVGLIIGIDLILGPLLTLIVFNTAKASLKKDLLIILAIQLAALTAGSFTIWHTRPVAVIYHYPEFTTIYANNTIVSKISPLLQQTVNNPPVLFYDDPTGGFDASYEKGKFYPYEPTSEVIQQMITATATEDKNAKQLLVPLDSVLNHGAKVTLDPKTFEVLSVLFTR